MSLTLSLSLFLLVNKAPKLKAGQKEARMVIVWSNNVQITLITKYILGIFHHLPERMANCDVSFTGERSDGQDGCVCGCLRK